MKKKWFDLKIFREGFRQLSLMALAFLGVLLLTSLISILQQPLSHHSLSPRVPLLMSPLSLQPLIVISFCLTAPLLTLKAFRFTTERRGSDFYHALPQRRECLFLSLLGAAFAWVFLILAASALVSGVAAGFFPAYYRFSWADLLQYNLVILLISLYVAAVTACGTFLSGTVFSNVLVSLLLLFAPRIIIHTLSSCIADHSFMLDRNLLPFPYRINLFSDFVYNFLNSGNSRLYGRSLFHWGRILYTFFALILWVGAGAFLARKRKSEAAEVPVANPRVRALVRIALAFLVWLIPLRSLLVHEHYSSFDYGIFGLFILLAFFGYELLATRNLKSLKKSLPSFGILLALCLGSLFFCRGCMRMAENWQPEATDIQHVRIMNSPGDYYFQEDNSLFSSRIEDTRITDKEVHRLVAELLKKTPARVTPGGYAYYIPDVHTKYTTSKTVAIKSGLVERYRTILLEDKEMEALSAALSKDEAFVKAYMELPDEKDPGIVVESIIRPDEDNKAALQIYRCLKEEVKEIGFTEWFNMQNNPVSGDSNAWIGLQSNRQGIASRVAFTISKKLPRTWALYQQLWAEANRLNRDKLISWIDQALAVRESGTAPRIQGDINIRAFNSSTGEDIVGYITTFVYPDGTGVLQDTQLKKLRDILSKLRFPDGLEPEYYGPVQIDISAYNGVEDINCMFTGETFPEGLRELLNP